jgi:serine/threonine protein phosphatase PrpC
MKDMGPHSSHLWEAVTGVLRKKSADPGLSPPDLYGIIETGRRERNEDAILALPLIDAHLLAVADGLGGHAAGDYASGLAIRVLKDGVISGYRPGMTILEIEDMLRALYDTAHHSIRNEAVGRREGMGTTLVSALIRRNEAVIANTGDSRAYLVDENIVRITKDHSVVQSLVDNGLITEEQAGRHPMRNILSSSLGGASFQIDLYHVSPMGGRPMLLLCSDGLSGYVGEEEMLAAARPSAEDAARRLVELALEHGSDDNVSVVVYQG